MAIAIIMVAWVTSSVLILKTNFMLGRVNGAAKCDLHEGGTRETKSVMQGTTPKVVLKGGLGWEEGSAGIIGLRTIFQTCRKAHDLQVIGK